MINRWRIVLAPVSDDPLWSAPRVFRPEDFGPGPHYQRSLPGSPVMAAVLRSMAGQHGGMVVPLHHQPVQVGRDRAVCRLVYQDGTPGVSSRHCQIFFDEQENLFVVTDLNSTYGTFLADGQRLAPNTPVKLAPRSSIYLGEVANTIYLELE